MLSSDHRGRYSRTVSELPMARAFEVAYEGTPTWETGRLQPAARRLIDEGAIRGRVLDAGCGTGRLAVELAQHGLVVVGVDVSDRAIRRARARAWSAGVRVSFVVADARVLRPGRAGLGDPFDTVLDVGLFHVLQPEDREPYAASLAAVTRPGGRGFVLAWSDRNPFGIGPARVRRRDLRLAFRARAGWQVEAIEPAVLETRLPMGRVHAWLATIRRR
jgi:SAM-dependent methyltransferase